MTAQLPVWKTGNTVWPKSGQSLIVPINFVFASAGAQEFDLATNEGLGFEAVQSVWFDNIDNAAAATLHILNTGQRIVMRERMQSSCPVMTEVPFRATIALAGAGTVKLIFSNLPCIPYTVERLVS